MANNNGFVVRVPKVASQSKDAQLYGTLKDLINRTNEQFAGCATQVDLVALAEIVAALTAADIAFVPVGDLAATNVQDALVELDTEKIGGSGTAGYIPVFTAARVLGDSPAYTDGVSAVGMDGYGSPPIFIGRRGNGTKEIPTAATVDQPMAFLQGIPYGTTAFAASPRAQIALRAAETCTDAAQGAFITFDTTPIGSTTIAEAGRFTPPGDLSLANDIVVGKSVLGMRTKVLTESTATRFVSVNVPVGGFISGECLYTVFAADATDQQARSGRLRFVATNKAGAVTVSINDIGSQEVASPVGTLTASLTVTTAPDAFTLRCYAVSSLTQTALLIRYRLDVLATSATVTGL